MMNTNRRRFQLITKKNTNSPDAVMQTLDPSNSRSTSCSRATTTSSAPTIVTNTKIKNIPSIKRATASEYYQIQDIHYNSPKGIEAHGAKKLHQNGYDGRNIKVAVIDSGIDASHVDLDGRVTKQTWFRYDDSNNGHSFNKYERVGGINNMDHGTHIAGTIHLMAPQAEIHDYRVLGRIGEVDTEEAICMAIYEACNDDCDVINLSLTSRWASSTIRSAVQYAFEQGVFVVCATGNEGKDNPLCNDKSYPALWDEAISVAAVCKRKGLPTSLFSDSYLKVDYAALGGSILSLKPGGGYQFISGTSIACPHVSGFITALLTKHKGLDHKELRSMLDSFVVYVGRNGSKDLETGVKFLTYLDHEECQLFWKKELQESRNMNSFFKNC